MRTFVSLLTAEKTWFDSFAANTEVVVTWRSVYISRRKTEFSPSVTFLLPVKISKSYTRSSSQKSVYVKIDMFCCDLTGRRHKCPLQNWTVDAIRGIRTKRWYNNQEILISVTLRLRRVRHFSQGSSLRARAKITTYEETQRAGEVIFARACGVLAHSNPEKNEGLLVVYITLLFIIWQTGPWWNGAFLLVPWAVRILQYGPLTEHISANGTHFR